MDTPRFRAPLRVPYHGMWDEARSRPPIPGSVDPTRVDHGVRTGGYTLTHSALRGMPFHVEQLPLEVACPASVAGTPGLLHENNSVVFGMPDPICVAEDESGSEGFTSPIPSEDHSMRIILGLPVRGRGYRDSAGNPGLTTDQPRGSSGRGTPWYSLFPGWRSGAYSGS